MPRPRGELRIVGGSWRSRRLRVPAGPGLRPTPDRVRETLFNWLGPWIGGRRVLDLFAGSGALGLEALSRGAGQAVFVDVSRPATVALKANIEMLQAASASVSCMDALRYLARGGAPFDLVFIDPPYASGLARPALGRLLAAGLFDPGGYVYIEEGADVRDAPASPWHVHREVRAGTVHGRLLRLDQAP